MAQFEGSFAGELGEKLYYRVWSIPKPKFNVIITHGQAEHSGCYQRWAERLQALGARVYAWDLLGHGRSEGRRGYSPSFHHYVHDLALFLEEVRWQDAPTILFGHSMGGLIVSRYLCENPEGGFKAQILSSPWFALNKKLPKVKEAASEWVSLLAPKVTVFNEMAFTDLTRDPAILSEHERDPLRHDRISPAVFVGAGRASSEVRAMAGRIKLPTYMMMSDNDPVTSTPAALDMLEAFGATDKQHKLYHDRKHELLNDLGREQVYDDLAAQIRLWI